MRSGLRATTTNMLAYGSRLFDIKSGREMISGKTDRLHVACIMDGNGRWATARHLPRSHGHKAGVEALRRVVAAAPDNGIATLTAYAFSSDNWQRPVLEVDSLIALFCNYLDTETANLVRDGVRLTVFGKRNRLPQALVEKIEQAELATHQGAVLHLRVAIDYSAQDAILSAVRVAANVQELTKEAFEEILTGCAGLTGVDLLIRTGGEQRLSDFLLWECAYAELFFTSRCWPEFSEENLVEALTEFRRRDRRFGRLTVKAA